MLQHFDKDGSGFITQDELEQALKEHGDAAELAAHISTILNDCDKDMVRYRTGTVAGMGSPLLQRWRRCRGDTACSIVVLCAAAGGMLLAEGWYAVCVPAAAACAAGLLQDGRIDYEEFCAMMRAGNEDVMKAHSTLKTGILGVKPPRVTE